MCCGLLVECVSSRTVSCQADRNKENGSVKVSLTLWYKWKPLREWIVLKWPNVFKRVVRTRLHSYQGYHERFCPKVRSNWWTKYCYYSNRRRGRGWMGCDLFCNVCVMLRLPTGTLRQPLRAIWFGGKSMLIANWFAISVYKMSLRGYVQGRALHAFIRMKKRCRE